jgi:FKBP-type peptidyl-prolyl cis-trans isomerase SlyD
MNVAHNTVVSLAYVLYDADGAVIEQGQQPLVYLHGGYDGIFPLVEQALEGKAEGEICRVRLAPADAFGEYDSELVRVETQDKFPAEVSVGMQFQGQASEQGGMVVYTVTDIADGKVVVDGNHPLAGQTLNFECTISSVRVATDEELTHGHVHGAHGHEH